MVRMISLNEKHIRAREGHMKINTVRALVVSFAGIVLFCIGIWWIALPACAWEGNSFAAVGLFGPLRFQAIEQAVQTRNYDAWRQLMAGRTILKTVTVQNFDEYARAWFASVSGDQTLMNAFKRKYQVRSSCPFSGWSFAGTGKK